jgi:hypothetical protein
VTIVRNVPIDAYHQHSAKTNTKLKVFKKSPLLYHKVYNEKSYQIPTTRALTLGQAIDTLRFDGREVYGQRFIMQPKTYPAEDGTAKDWHGQANYCKAWARSQVLHGRTVLTYDEQMMIEAMNLEISRHPIASALLAQGESQLTFRRTSERFEMEVQVRPDHFSENPIEVMHRGEIALSSNGKPYMADLKSIDDLDNLYDVLDPESPRTGRPITKHGYYRQGGLAQWVAAQDVGETAHFLIFVEKAEPHRVAVVELDGDFLDIGYSEVAADLQRLRQCEVANVWPGSPEHVIKMFAPEWLTERANREAVARMDVGAPVEAEA